MSVLIVLESSRAASAVVEYGAVHGRRLDAVTNVEQGTRLARSRRYATVICDASFESVCCNAGLGIAHAAKHADRRTQTIVLATWMSPAMQDARSSGDVDVILLKPLPLSMLFSYVRWEPLGASRRLHPI